jgi:hypothetical protein
LSATFSQLANLGITSNGQDNTITLDTTVLGTALTNNLTQVQSFFTDATNGWATKLDTSLANTVGDSGSISTHQAALTASSASITTQIANLEKQVTADSANWTTEFQNMETAQSQTNQELTFLSQSVSNGSLENEPHRPHEKSRRRKTGWLVPARVRMAGCLPDVCRLCHPARLRLAVPVRSPAAKYFFQSVGIACQPATRRSIAAGIRRTWCLPVG